MKNLFDLNDTAEILNRVANLKSTTQRLWGKMQVDQMLAHCSATLQMATGETKLPRPFFAKIIGGLLKNTYTNDKPLAKNTPTNDILIFTDQRDFELERQKLKDYIKKFQSGGESKCTKHPHPFFGNFTPTEWSIGMYKHLDHHLRQFGV